NFESQLVTVNTRKFVLKLLEKLLDRGGTPANRMLIVTTSVDPIANFQEVFDDERQGTYTNVVPEVELSQTSLLLSRFRRCYRPALCEVSSRQRWNNWLNYEPADWEDTITLEANKYEPLSEIANEIRSSG